MKLFRKIVDERQEQELMRIERNAYYVLLFGLAGAILIQITMFGFDITHVAGEAIMMLIGFTYALIGYIRRGIWDYFTKPGIKSYLIYGSVAGISYGVLGYFRSDMSLLDFLPTFVLRFLWLFVIIFLFLALTGTVIKLRTKKLQQEYEDNTL